MATFLDKVKESLKRFARRVKKISYYYSRNIQFEEVEKEILDKLKANKKIEEKKKRDDSITLVYFDSPDEKGYLKIQVDKTNTDDKYKITVYEDKRIEIKEEKKKDDTFDK